MLVDLSQTWIFQAHTTQNVIQTLVCELSLCRRTTIVSGLFLLIRTPTIRGRYNFVCLTPVLDHHCQSVGILDRENNVSILGERPRKAPCLQQGNCISFTLTCSLSYAADSLGKLSNECLSVLKSFFQFIVSTHKVR